MALLLLIFKSSNKFKMLLICIKIETGACIIIYKLYYRNTTNLKVIVNNKMYINRGLPSFEGCSNDLSWWYNGGHNLWSAFPECCYNSGVASVLMVNNLGIGTGSLWWFVNPNSNLQISETDTNLLKHCNRVYTSVYLHN